MNVVATRIVASLLVLASFSNVANAKEGMWIPTLLQALEGDMQAMGLRLTADDIYSINHSSLKDAVVHFGGGCTAEMVSDRGFFLQITIVVMEKFSTTVRLRMITYKMGFGL